MGEDFSLLPGAAGANGQGALTGYGWDQDQSCFGNGVYIASDHPALSGQSRGTLDVSVDGYFSNVPPAAKVLLRRESNRSAALIEYGYGQGRVVAGTIFPEVNRALKGLALGHKNYEVRSQAGMALVNSIIMDPSVGDRQFIIQWAGTPSKNIDEEDAKVWSIYAMDKTWSSQYIPILIQMIKSPTWLIRSEAVKLLGKHKVTEAVPYLEEVLKKDKEVQLGACDALRKITGREYFVEVYESDFTPDNPRLNRIKSGELPYYKLLGKNRP